MKVASKALQRQSGAVSAFLIGLAGLAGFAAGALLVGTVALTPRPTPTGDLLGIAVASSSSHDVARLEAVSTYAPDRLAVAGPWPFESTSPAAPAGVAPGKTRPDRLSAPEGWTYEATAQTE
jgi:hypothetical protein